MASDQNIDIIVNDTPNIDININENNINILVNPDQHIIVYAVPISSTSIISGGISDPEPHLGSEVIGGQLTTTMLFPKLIAVERQMLIPILDYSISGNVITFNISLNPEDNIVVFA